MKRLLLVIILLGIVSSTFAADANTVVHQLQMTVECTGTTKYTCKVHQSITILNEKGRSAAQFAFSTDQTRKLTAFNAVISNAAGQVIRKVKKNDLQYTQYHPQMVVDGGTYYFAYQPVSYPVTIDFDYEYANSNGFVSFPAFCPATEYGTEVRHAVYTLRVPNNMEVRSKLLNMPDNSIVTTTEGNKKCLTITIENQQQLHREALMPPVTERLPIAYFAPVGFQFLGTEGSMKTWEDFGRWQNTLIEGRDLLTPTQQQALKQMTDTCATTWDKVKTVYNLLRYSTRYNSIQLGIGGWQPAKASDVSQLGMGDCKGLTNYMKAMLKAIGIESHYTVISTSYKHLFYDYPSLSQLNHAILQVPMQEDTLWIECTNPSLPLGYLHEDIAGHDAVLITKEGGKIVTLPEYNSNDSKWNTVTHITLKDNGNAHINYRARMQGMYYEDWQWAENADTTRIAQRMQRMYRLPKAKFLKIKTTRDERPQCPPAIDICIEVECENLATVNQQRLFLPVSPIDNMRYNTLSDATRHNDIYIDQDMLTTDSIYIHLPKGFSIESIPTAFQNNTDITSTQIQLYNDNNAIIAVETTQTHKGLYNKSLYPTLLQQQQNLLRWRKQQIVLRR